MQPTKSNTFFFSVPSMRRLLFSYQAYLVWWQLTQNQSTLAQGICGDKIGLGKVRNQSPVKPNVWTPNNTGLHRISAHCTMHCQPAVRDGVGRGKPVKNKREWQTFAVVGFRLSNIDRLSFTGEKRALIPLRLPMRSR